MSKNRENVTWQSPDGKWNRGFFAFSVTGPDDEWDVHYDRDTFMWVATGLPSEDAAHNAWQGANPGGSQIVRLTTKNRSEIKRYDKMATKAKVRKTGADLDRDIRAVLPRGSW